ncbi:MAG: hypothetical protein OXH68_21025 [Gammaproteobacteria bacterium]|nr:hypothetical protein [Gammaproteobacteria bacterium]
MTRKILKGVVWGAFMAFAVIQTQAYISPDDYNAQMCHGECERGYEDCMAERRKGWKQWWDFGHGWLECLGDREDCIDHCLSNYPPNVPLT